MALKYVDDIGRIVNEQVNIVDVVSEHVSLKKAGRNYKGLCPFHSEKTPSFVVDPERQYFKCFGCGAGGNALQFFMQMEHLDFLPALELFCERNHIDLEPYRTNTDTERVPTKPFYELNKKAALYYLHELQTNKEAKEYLKKRGISDETAKAFGLGVAPDEWDALFKALKPGQQLIEPSGLFSKTKHGNTIDRFRNRLMFPIINLQRKVIGFGARSMDGSEPKYLNSPDTVLFNKSFHVFGLNLAKNHLEKPELLLVEGYMDVIGLYDKGIKNAVASLGTAFTKEQAKLLSRYAKELIVLFDGDDAGKKATRRAVEILKETDLKTYIVTLPERKDPDEYVLAYGKDAFLSYLEKNKKDIYSYLLDEAREKYDISQISGKTEFLKESLKILSDIKEQSVKEIYLQTIATELNTSLNSLKQDLAFEPKKEIKETVRRTKVEERFLKVLLEHPEIAKEVMNHGLFGLFKENEKKLICLIVEKNGYNRESVLDHFEIAEIEEWEQLLKAKPNETDVENWTSLFKSYALELIDKKIEAIRKSDLERQMILQAVEKLMDLRMKLSH
ncbi:DNA primase [Guggenheimella bovis]